MEAAFEFAGRLKILRERSNLNQTELADQLNKLSGSSLTTRGSISHYENNQRRPDIDFLDTVCKFFNVSPQYMLGYDDNNKIIVNVDSEEEEFSNIVVDIYKRFKENNDEDRLYALEFLLGSEDFENLLFYIASYIFETEEDAISDYEFAIEQLEKSNKLNEAARYRKIMATIRRIGYEGYLKTKIEATMSNILNNERKSFFDFIVEEKQEENELKEGATIGNN